MKTFLNWRFKKQFGLIPSLTIFFLLTFGSNTNAIQATDQFAPESSYSLKTQTSVSADKFIISTAHPLASQAGYDILAKGGNAIDAMIVVQTVLGLVEPQSSGLGGGAFLLHYDHKKQKLQSFDGRETAPLNSNENLFLSADSTPMKFLDAVIGGRSVGTPGTVKLLWNMHLSHGRMTWPDLLAPAISLAEKGFKVSPRLANAIEKGKKNLSFDPITKQYFIPNGVPLKAGETLRNPEYAKTLRLLAREGGNAFYQKGFSQGLVKKVQHSKNPGQLSNEDFANYRIIERKPLCSTYKEYKLCGMGPPSSGTTSINSILGMLESSELWKKANAAISGPAPWLNIQNWHYIAEASRLAFADRGNYIADPDFVSIPAGLLSKPYLSERAKLIHSTTRSVHISHGVPPGVAANLFKPAPSPEQDSTTHFVIVDQDKNIVSMTSTIENGFGSRLMVNGFLLNNELTDFSFANIKNGTKVANRVEPGKRPRSSMAPIIVFKDNEPFLALGSTGGSRIINYLVNALIAVIDWQLPLQSAINLPHIVNRFGTMDIEESTEATTFDSAFIKKGYKTSIRNLNSGTHGVLFRNENMIGAADKRREGLVLGR